MVSKLGVTPEIIPQVDTAVKTAIADAAPEDAICIAGSLYVVGEAKTALDPSLEPSLIV
jgi:dihydrofolate synthase/folylpolyglutamate synthase